MELLAPAGNLEKAKIALMYGADAVYVGGKKFSLRARASNFELDDLKAIADVAHSMNKKVYVTMNIVPHDEDFEGIDDYLTYLGEIKIDGIITTSLYIINKAKTLCPNVEIHISTQNSITNGEAIKFYASLGAKRVVLAREVTLEELATIRKNTDLDLEYFIHGGMCASFSGRCVLSNYMTNRDANRGGCAHSCRWNYELFQNGSKVSDSYFSMGSKDLMVIRYLPKLIDLGITSLKIEGRMKSTYYLACVIKTYRELIDKYVQERVLTDSDYDYFENEIRKAENRLTSIGFYNGLPTEEEQLYDNRSEHPTKEYVGVILDYNKETKIALIEQRNYFEVGDTLEFFGPHLPNTQITCPKFIDANTKEELTVARHPLQLIAMQVDIDLKPFDMVRLVQK